MNFACWIIFTFGLTFLGCTKLYELHRNKMEDEIIDLRWKNINLEREKVGLPPIDHPGER